jgi:hypothetical protein
MRFISITIACNHNKAVTKAVTNVLMYINSQNTACTFSISYYIFRYFIVVLV